MKHYIHNSSTGMQCNSITQKQYKKLTAVTTTKNIVLFANKWPQHTRSATTLRNVQYTHFIHVALGWPHVPVVHSVSTSWIVHSLVFYSCGWFLLLSLHVCFCCFSFFLRVCSTFFAFPLLSFWQPIVPQLSVVPSFSLFTLILLSFLFILPFSFFFHLTECNFTCEYTSPSKSCSTFLQSWGKFRKLKKIVNSGKCGFRSWVGRSTLIQQYYLHLFPNTHLL